LDDFTTKGFRSITEELKKQGYSLTPARVRIILMSSLEKIVRDIAMRYGKPISKKSAKEIVKHPDFQNRIVPILDMVYGKENTY